MAGRGYQALRQAAPPNIHVLNDDQVVIDGVRFLGSILWTDFALFGEVDKVFTMQQARRTMNDFTRIRRGGRSFTPEDSILLHQHSRRWLENRLAERRRWLSRIMPLPRARCIRVTRGTC